MDTPPSEFFPSKSYALTGKIMVVAIVVLFSVMILILLLHLYARWYLRQRQPRHVITHRPRHVILHSPDSSSFPRGLDKAVLASLPIVEYAHEEAGAYSTALPLLEECSVCLSEFETGEKLRLLPKCGHGFHIDCIGMWFHSHATCPVCRSVVEKIDGELVLTGRVKPGSNSGLCATCRSNSTVDQKIRAEFGLPGRVGSGSCVTCHICVSTVEQSAHTESGLSGQGGPGSCATCHIGICTSTFEQSANAESGLLGSGSTVTCESTSMLGDKSWRNGRIRIEVPSRTELKSESGFSSPASQGFWTPGKRILSLNRIFSMGKRSTQDSPVVGDGPSCDRNEIDLECGVNEPTQHSRAHTPR